MRAVRRIRSPLKTVWSFCPCLPRLRLKIHFAIEVDLTINQSHIDSRVGAQRMSGEDHEIRVLPYFDAADTLIDAKLYRRVQSDEFQSIVFSQFTIAVMQCPACLLV